MSSSPTDVRQMSSDIRKGGRSEVALTLEDLPKSAPTDVERTSKFHSVEINIYFLSLSLPLTFLLYFLLYCISISYLKFFFKEVYTLTRFEPGTTEWNPSALPSLLNCNTFDS